MLNVVTEPTVLVVGTTRMNVAAHAMLGPEDMLRGGLAEFAGKLCYMSFGKGRTGQEYIDHILESGHGSVLEHESLSVLVEGVSRTLTHEWVRHRAGWAYSQLSQRYVDESNVAFVPPPELAPGTPEWEAWSSTCRLALTEYCGLVDKLGAKLAGEGSPTERRKRVRQAARSVLPGCTETKIVATANLRAWRHFLEMRGSEFADLEIRRLAVKILDELKYHFPMVFRDFSVEEHPSGIPVLRSRWRKV